MLLWKDVPCLKKLQKTYCVHYCTVIYLAYWLLLRKKCIFVTVAVTTFCERPFALHHQQLENDKQNIDVGPSLEKFLRTPIAKAVQPASSEAILWGREAMRNSGISSPN